eukprot:COSAG02_NODE_2118_length_9784_cov_337.366649_7_plen_156_part_00
MPQGPTLKILRSARTIIDRVQPPSWLSNLVQQRQDRDETVDRRRHFLASDCRNSVGASGLTRTAVVLGEYPVGYIDVAPTRGLQGEDDAPAAAAAPARVRTVSFADERVRFIAARARTLSLVDNPAATTGGNNWWDLRGAAGAHVPHTPQMRATM